MYLFKRIGLVRDLRQHARHIIQCTYATSNVQNSENLQFNSEFTPEEQTKILSVLNEGSVEKLARFDMTIGRIKNLENWRKKNGQFPSLSKILEVDGMGERVLQRLCTSIVATTTTDAHITANTSFVKNRRQLLTPVMLPEVLDRLNNIVGIHLAPGGISWSKMSRDGNEVVDWGFYHFNSLPKRMLPTDTFMVATDVLTKIPTGDIYVMEAAASTSPQNSKQPIPAYMQNTELNSMLLALLNTSPKHNTSIVIKEDLKFPDFYENKVYYLRSKLPARLFSTLVGNERVATNGIIAQLLQKTGTLPCSNISIKPDICERYTANNSAHRDIMGQALLLTISFMDLCVYKNPASAAALLPRRRTIPNLL